LGNTVMELSAMFIRDVSHIVKKKKCHCDCTKLIFNNILHPTALYDKITSCTISLLFSAFALPIQFIQTFSDAFQAFLSVKFNFVLKSCFSNSVICGPTKIPSLILASFILGHFCLKETLFAFFIHCFYKYSDQTELDMR
jgi:hypothetical protein